MRPISILFLHTKTFPCSHASLETVYTHILPQRGHKVAWVMPSADAQHIRRWNIESWNGTKVYLLEGDLKRGWIQKLTGRFTRQYRVVQYALNHEKIDIIQVRNDWIGGMIGAYFQRQRKIPFVYQISYPFPETLLMSGGLRGVLGVFVKRIQSLLIKEAALVLPISEWMQQRFEAEGVPSRKLMSFPLGADTSLRPDEVDGQEMRQWLGIENRPTMIYFGAMDRVRQLDFLLRVMRSVAEQIPEIRLIMVGKGNEEADLEWLKSSAVALGIDRNVIFTGHVLRTEIPKYLAAADLSVSPIVPLPIYQVSSPTKLIESMAMARPVIANDIPEQQSVLTQSGGGICIPYREDSFAEAIVWLLQHPRESKEMGKRGRRFVEQHRSYLILAERLERAYYQLIG